MRNLTCLFTAVILTAGVLFAAEPADTKARMKESRDQYVSGEFEKAQAGFEEIIKIEPENKLARLYLRQLLERDARQVEVSAMKEVGESWNTDLVLRSYILSDDAITTMGLNGLQKSAAVEQHFPEVSFPDGASAVYHPETQTVFVRNTQPNLAVIEEILIALDVNAISSDIDQVEIEAKFVEVSEGTLEELGFEWQSANGEDISLTDSWSADGSFFLFDDALRGGPSGPDMPFDRPSDLGAGQDPGRGDWSATRFADTFNGDPANVTLQFRGGTPLDIVISALDQSSGADVLSAPRVVTKSGKRATIRVGQMHHYPEIYEADTTQATLPNISYTEFEEKLLGVELEVTPELDGDQIELNLNPRITELAGWQNYELAPANSIYNHRQDKSQVLYGHPALEARLPIFKTRTIQTSVTIADGGTIGMGGLISERVDAYEDRVPLLGSIPLVGRLFRNEGERAVKRNLMMFVTAKKVEPTGRINTARSFEYVFPIMGKKRPTKNGI